MDSEAQQLDTVFQLREGHDCGSKGWGGPSGDTKGAVGVSWYSSLPGKGTELLDTSASFSLHSPSPQGPGAQAREWEHCHFHRESLPTSGQGDASKEHLVESLGGNGPAWKTLLPTCPGHPG